MEADKNWLATINQSLTAPKAWQTAGTVKTLIIYSTALSSLWMEQENFWWHQLFQELQNFVVFWSAIFLNRRNLEMSPVGKARSVFVRYTLPVTTPWASGGMNFSTASQNISALIWKWKWFMWHLFQVLETAMIVEHILNWWNVLCILSRQCLKNIQKLRQKILEDHWQLFWQINKTNQPQIHSMLTHVHRFSKGE